MEKLLLNFEEEWKQCLASVQINDCFNFPSSCDTITKYMMELIKKTDLIQYYDFIYIRGHYIEDHDELYCEDYHDLTHKELRASVLAGRKNECMNCTCDSVIQHSYIEAISKENSEIFILDFSRYQFKEDYFILLDEGYTINQLMDVCSYLVAKKDVDFKNYYPSQKIIAFGDFDQDFNFIDFIEQRVIA